MSNIVTGFQTGHVGLNVTDLSRAMEFYLLVFGFEKSAESTEEGKKFAMLTHNGKLVLTLWQQSSAQFSKDIAGLHHLSFQAESVEQIRDIEARLRQNGVKLIYDGIVPHREGANSGGIFFEDPDGIRLEIFVPSGVGEYPAPTADAPSCGFF